MQSKLSWVHVLCDFINAEVYNMYKLNFKEYRPNTLGNGTL